MESLKRFAKQKIGRFILKKLLALAAPYLVPIMLIFLAALLIENMLFASPMAQEAATGQKAFFFGSMGNQALESRYRELVEQDLGSTVSQSYTPSQYDQSNQYKLSWAVLAAIDRVLGDPIMHDKVQSKPDPMKVYEVLKPAFTWRESKVTVTKTVTENGSTRTEEETHIVSLLAKVDAYNAQHTMIYRWVDTKQGDLSIHHEVLETTEIRFYDESENRLIQLLTKSGLPKRDFDLVRELALTYSDDPRREETELLLSRYANRAPGTNAPGSPIPQAPGKWNGGLPLTGENGKDYVITSWFGYRSDPFTGKTAYHDGVDLAAPTGTPVYAPLDGIVQYAASMSGYGNTIMLSHGSVITLYGHLSSIAVRSGEEVRQGALIGKVGSTGRSTGPHLHWGAYQSNFSKTNAFDPMSLLK